MLVSATIAHLDQKEIPYITHPCAMGIILARFGCSDSVIKARASCIGRAE